LTGIDISYTWITLGSAKPARYFYAYVLPVTLTRDCSRPAIYRWALFAPAIHPPVEAYIGETENLARRLRHYLRPGPSQHTNIRLRKHFLAQAEKGVRAELQVLQFQPFRLNSVVISETKLHNTSIRQMLEQFLIADHDAVNCALLNLKSNSIERRLRAALKSNAEAN
jgi:hypothetical protein